MARRKVPPAPDGLNGRPWPAAEVVMRAVSALVPAANNPRSHSAEQVDQVVASIRRFGWTVPVLIDETGLLIAGHARVMAAHKVGLKDIPAMVARGWSEEEKQAYMIADNQLGLNSSWNANLLKINLSSLNVAGFDLKLTGFSLGVIGGLLGPDVAPENEWTGMQEFDQPDASGFRSIVVHFKDQDAVDEFARRIGQKISEKVRFAWFPAVPYETFMDKRYTAEPEPAEEPETAGA
jgi:ParB-like chromosome segregation protein Spo0J